MLGTQVTGHDYGVYWTGLWGLMDDTIGKLSMMVSYWLMRKVSTEDIDGIMGGGAMHMTHVTPIQPASDTHITPI